jgi:molybdopterin synthase sulfur carrier subunit
MQVNFSATYRNITGIRSFELEVNEGDTVSDGIQKILKLHPELRAHWVNEAGELHAHLTVILNKADILSLPEGLDTPLKPDDIFDFVPPVGGG